MGVRYLIILFLFLLAIFPQQILTRIIRYSPTTSGDFPVSVSFPDREITQGDNVTLSCNYQLPSRLLYTVRWCFNGVEFFRFKTKSKPHKQATPDSGVTVDLNSSNQTSVTILNIQKAGQFKCEVIKYDDFKSSSYADRLDVIMTSGSRSFIKTTSDIWLTIYICLLLSGSTFVR